MTFIAISGVKGSGKSTLAQEIVRTSYTRPALILPLAAGIKQAVHAWFGEPTDKEDVLAHGLTARRLYQEVGNGGRSIHPDFWLHVWERSLVESLTKSVMMDEQVVSDGSPIVIIDDIRFRNELEYFANKEALLVRLCRGFPSPDTHISEHDLDDVPLDRYHVAIEDGTSISNSMQKVIEFAWRGGWTR